MKRKLFFAFSAFIDELGIDPKDIAKSMSGKNQQEVGFAIIFVLLSKVHKAKTTYIPFVTELCGCTEEEAEAKDVEDVLKIAFSNADVKAFFT